MTQVITAQDITTIVAEAKEAARVAATKYFNEKLGGVDQFSCGFSWVEIYGIRGNTKQGKQFKAAGITKNYNGAYSIWNPSGLAVQNIDTLEAGAEAAARVFEAHGFKAYACSRLD